MELYHVGVTTVCVCGGLCWLGADRLPGSVGPEGRAITYGYAGGDLTTVTDPRGKVWTYAYDANHRMTSKQSPAQLAAGTTFKVTNHYDTSGRVDSQTVPLNPATGQNTPASGTTTMSYATMRRNCTRSPAACST